MPVRRLLERAPGPLRVRAIEAVALAEEERSWACLTCDTVVEGDGRHCRACTAYWADAAAGVFEDD